MKFINRCALTGIALVTCLCVLSVNSAQAQTDMTAAELLEKGIEQYEQGMLDDAYETLQRVDRVQLGDAQQQKLDEVLAEVSSGYQARHTLQQAMEAERSGDLQRALELYKAVTADREAAREVREAALTGMARVERWMNNGQTRPAPVAQVDTIDEQPAEQATEVQPEQSEQVEAAEQAAPAEQAAEARPEPAQEEAQPAQQADLLQQVALLRVQKLVAEAEQAAGDGEYNLARQKLQSALAMDPDHNRARELLESVNAMLERDAGTGVLQNYTERLQLLAEQTRARYQQAMQRAESAYEAGNYTAAEDAVTLAKSILDTNRRYLPEAEYAQLRQQTLDRAAAISAAAEQARLERIARESDIAEQQAEQARLEARQRMEEKKDDLLRRALDLAREQKYNDALRLVDQVLFIDPEDVRGQFMRQMMADQALYKDTRELTQNRDNAIAALRPGFLIDSTPLVDELMLYPPDWPQITLDRRKYVQAATGDSQVNRETREKLQQPIPVELQNVRFESVIDYLRDLTDADFYVNWRALEESGIDRNQLVDVNIGTQPADVALQRILEDVAGSGEFVEPLDYTIENGVVVISTQRQLQDRTEIRTYDIRDLILQVPNFDDAPDFDLSQISSDSGDGGGGDIFGDGEGDDQEPVTREVLVNQILDLTRSLVSPDDWDPTGPSTLAEYNGTLFVNTTAKNHVEIDRMLKRMREQRALQISIDARFLFVTQNFLEEVGVDVDLAINSTAADWVNEPILIGNNTLDMTTAASTGLPGSLAPTDTTPSFFASSVNAEPISFLIDDLQVDLIVRATQQDRRAIEVNTPRLTFFNGQRAYVVVATQTAYVSDLEPVTSGDAIAFDPEVAVFAEGVVLDVQGTISADRRYVTLTLRPSLAELDVLENFQVTAFNEGDEDSPSIAITGFIQQPTIRLTSVRSTVSVPDKGTLMLGGQRLMAEIDTEAGTPVLSKIPIINRLFTNRSTIKDERTLLLLIKPTIILQAEHEERLFPGLEQSPEAYNLSAQPMP